MKDEKKPKTVWATLATYRPLDCGDGSGVLAYGQSHHRDYTHYVRAGLKCLLHLKKAGRQ